MQALAHARYPGETTSSVELVLLAECYRAAARAVQVLGQAGNPLSLAPYRLNALHAIELYLSGLLLHRGHEPGQVRALQHDLAARAELASEYGLKLRVRTLLHLRTLQDTREYIVARYAPEAAGSLSQVNRMAATLEEVARKATQIVSQAQAG